MSKKPIVAAIAAIGKNRVLGLGNKLLWHIPADLQRFRSITAGHPVIMGWNTFQSILGYTGGKPLADRTNIVVSDRPWNFEGVVVAASIEEAIEKASKLDPEIVFVAGGALTYEAALPYTDRLYLTLIEDEKEGDAFFPPYESEFSRIVAEEAGLWQGTRFCWVQRERNTI